MENQTGENNTGQAPRKNSNVIYFLIVVVLALLATDVYLYLQKNKADTRIVYQNDEKTRLQTELDSLEAQIEQVNIGKTKLTVAELNKAQEDVKQLRYFVTKYTADIEELKQQNKTLANERDTLKTNLATVSQKATTLEKQNEDLGEKVKVGSAIKLATADVVAYKIKSSGKEVDVKRASPAKKIKINFTIASNAIAQKGMHDIFVRIIDPAGNLATAPE